MSYEIYKQGTCEETGAHYKVYKHPVTAGVYSIVFYRSKRIKNPSYYTSKDIDKDIETLFNQVKKRKDEKKQYRNLKKSQAVERQLKVGDVLVCSWGGTMSIVDFYRVTELVGKCSVKIESISSIASDHDSVGGYYVEPDEEQAGDPITDRRFKVSSSGDSIMITDCQYARLYTGGKHYVNRND
ncbi:MAG: YagA-like protein [Caudoviricetes sp.]|nr:MAG: YagA-like protein [Caudoviricetes sp.]